MNRRCWFLAFMAVVGAPAALGAEWSEFATDGNGNRYSLDQQSVLREGPIAKGVVRAEYAEPRTDPTTGKGVFAAIDRMIVDCGAASFALQSRTYVLADGKEVPALASSREDREMRPAAAGSISESIVRVLCRANRVN